MTTDANRILHALRAGWSFTDLVEHGNWAGIGFKKPGRRSWSYLAGVTTLSKLLDQVGVAR